MNTLKSTLIVSKICLVAGLIVCACFLVGCQLLNGDKQTNLANNTPSSPTLLASSPVATTLMAAQVTPISPTSSPEETPTASITEASTMPEASSSCPITPIQEDFWSRVSPVAGEFPVWISSQGRISYANSGPYILPPESDELVFNRGIATKALIFVDKEVEGDLTITGKRLDGPELIYFSSAGEEEVTTRIDATTLQLLTTPPTSREIPSAHISTHLPEPDGKAHHGMGLIYISPGCYEFTTTINQYTVKIVLELLGE